MKVAITGSTGHIGANLVRKLLAQGQSPRVLVYGDDAPLAGLDVERVSGDVRDPLVLDKLLAGVDVVYNLAAHISLKSGHDPLTQLNIDGPRAVVDACLRQGVRRLVHFSSVHALRAPPSGQTIGEDALPADRPHDLPYDRSKAAGEAIVRAGVARGLHAVICSPSGVVGPHDYQPSFMGEGLMRMYDGAVPALVAGAYDFVHVADVVAGALAAAEHGHAGQRYLLTGHRLSVRQIAELVSAVGGRPAPRLQTPWWLVRATVPAAELWAKLTRTRPVYTAASLQILRSNCDFVRPLTERHLGYTVQPPIAMVRDALAWFQHAGRLRRRAPWALMQAAE